jgi:hypothetical protein
MREQEADYDDYLRSLQHSSSDEDEDEGEGEDDDEESITSEMPTDTRGDAIVLSSDDSTQKLQPEQKGSDRAAEFDGSRALSVLRRSMMRSIKCGNRSQASWWATSKKIHCTRQSPMIPCAA